MNICSLYLERSIVNTVFFSRMRKLQRSLKQAIQLALIIIQTIQIVAAAAATTPYYIYITVKRLFILFSNWVIQQIFTYKNILINSRVWNHLNINCNDQEMSASSRICWWYCLFRYRFHSLLILIHWSKLYADRDKKKPNHHHSNR